MILIFFTLFVFRLRINKVGYPKIEQTSNFLKCYKTRLPFENYDLNS